MGIADRIGRFSNRVYDRMRHDEAFAISDADAVHGSFDALRGYKYALLVTFRRNGVAVPSPVWFGLDDAGRAYVRTMRETGKVKRIRNDGRALIVASTMRGKPIGRPVAAVARVLPEDEWPRAEAVLAAAYGAGRKVYERVLGDAEGLGTYIEISPLPPE